MKSIYKLKFNTLEKSLKDLFSELDKIDKTHLIQKSSEEKWSIIQILQHLLKSEQLSVISIKHTISKDKKIKESNIMSYLRGIVLKLALNTNFKFKALQNVSELSNNVNLDDIKTKWAKVRKTLREIIETTDVQILKSDIFAHPLAGKMNLNAAINFMQAHFDHYKKQIYKYL